MKTFNIILFQLIFIFSLFAQEYYFPPLIGNTWTSISPEELGWCEDKIPALYDYLDSEDTKAFIVLKDGKIVLEKYFGQFTMDSVWYWASAGKTLTSFLVGLAQEEGHMSIHDPTVNYLGKGWTSLPENKENEITVWHQLTMTSGLDDGGDPYCTDVPCLTYKADAGTRWAYHNAPYTLLDQVVENATGQTLNIFGYQRLFSKTGMAGLFIKSGFNNVFWSKPRTMARFGSLILNKGKWNTTQIMTHSDYFNASVNTTQNLNLSYGYLWWLNGKNSAMLPGSQIVFNRPLFLNAPSDMISALGKNGQILNIVPSQNLVMVRMGNFTDNLPVPFLINDEIWAHFNEVQCTSSSEEVTSSKTKVKFFPNPSTSDITIQADKIIQNVHLYDGFGQMVGSWFGIDNQTTFTLTNVSQYSGMYVVEVVLSNGEVIRQKHLFIR
ncbi:MAG: serine hydrolase [Saprospiraceae bacterium]